MMRAQTSGRWTNICRDGEASRVLARRGRGRETLHALREGGVGEVAGEGEILSVDAAVAFVIPSDLKMESRKSFVRLWLAVGFRGS